jgi:hypothetical protein
MNTDKHRVRQASLAFLAGESPAYIKVSHRYITDGCMGGGNKTHEATRKEVLERNGTSRECVEPRKYHVWRRRQFSANWKAVWSNSRW